MTKGTYEHVYAVLQADLYQGPAAPLEVLITVKEIVRSEELAEREVARLNALRNDGSVRYWWQVSRLFAPGQSASSDDGSA
jgi:hypothetical protein